MNGSLNKEQVKYVLYHLNLHFRVSADIREHIQLIPAHSHQQIKPGSIVFKLSSEPFLIENVITARELPVLFPVGESSELFKWENGSLVFQHDLLKSAFFLLSGYQETLPSGRDHFNRFRYEGSIQHQLGIEHVPLVNYYFKFIGEGIGEFCDRRRIPFNQNRLFDTFGFLLTHDVDVVDTYTFHDLVYRVKKVLGLAPSSNSKIKSFRFLLKYLGNYLKFFNRPNPHWDFEYLVGSAKKYGFKSVFYFLHKELKHQDSYYRFGDKRLRNLFAYLRREECEIGLHGSIRSADHLAILKYHLQLLEQYSKGLVFGIRQHRLIYKHPGTSRLHAACGFSYDASLGFAEHEGFRNSFCMPFKLYDFEKEEMMDVWEIPLVVMDATLYQYRKMNPLSSLESVEKLVGECEKFNGIFTLLWHNGNFDDENYPEARELFENILRHMYSKQCQSVTGHSCIEQHLLPIFEED